MLDQKYIERIAGEVQVRPEQVVKTVELFDGGATIPFVARYRKDVTGNLDEVKLEAVAEKNEYYSELAGRKVFVLDAIAKQDKLTDELRQAIEACYDKTLLEDLYRPFKKARRTKATIAREKGLEPLAEFILKQIPVSGTLDEYASAFVKPDKAVLSTEEALEGARHIIAEIVALEPETRGLVRERMLQDGAITAHPTKNAEGAKTKFEAYYSFTEPVSKIPSHRFLAIMRGAKEGVLRMALALDDEKMGHDLVAKYVKAPGSIFEAELKPAVLDAYNRLLRPSIETEVLNLVRERADLEAIRVFRENAENLLLSPPAGSITVVGVDPGVRTGCKLAVVNSAGAHVESATVYPHEPQKDVENAERILVELLQKHNAVAVAVGNGTASRETFALVRGALAKLKRSDVFAVLVNEAGASIYSTSKVAREEFPELDVTIRSAISIARRLQDPLAELVKIEPRHVGVGQYQHDVNQKDLREGLQRTVVSCVNRVGVDLNTASKELLRYVSGIQSDTAQNIVTFRHQAGRFASRAQLMDVDGVGPKVFEQAAGFLRISAGANPLDNTGIHPEAYPVVEQISQAVGVDLPKLLENPKVLEGLDLSSFAGGVIGTLTLEDIRRELMKPGRDPRTEFRAPKFLDGVSSVGELEEGMEMEGVVTNVTDFGAFVDIGVHQDGLVHLSELANRFVQDPREVVKVGEIVRVKVIKVDKELPRISLSMKALLPERTAQRRARPRRERADGHEGEAPRAPRREGEPARAPRRDEGGAPRGPRPEGDAHGAREGQERRPRRPEKGKARKGGRDQQRQDDRQKRQREPEPLNTQLADQLAALKNKFSS